MRHTITTEGFGVRLRPVRLDDAGFIVWLRNLAHARGRIGDTAADVEAQTAWLQAYFDRPGDYYFIIETQGGSAAGAYGLYDMDAASAESGRWVIRPEVPAAIPSAILAFDLAFDRLKFQRLRVKTVSTNRNVLSLNRKFGLREVRTEESERTIGGAPVTMVHFVLEASDWPQVRNRLVPLARLAEKQIRDVDIVLAGPGNSLGTRT